jgi:hypothetical protein
MGRRMMRAITLALPQAWGGQRGVCVCVHTFDYHPWRQGWGRRGMGKELEHSIMDGVHLHWTYM